MVYWKNKMKAYIEAHIGDIWHVDSRKTGQVFWTGVDVIGSGRSSDKFGSTNGAGEDW